MDNGRIRHDCAWEQAHQMLKLAAPLLRDEEMRDFLNEAYAIALTRLECYAVQRSRMQERLKPSLN